MIQGSLAAKIGGGLAVAAGSGTGLYFAHDYFSNTLSKYDTALIGYLDKDENNDISFEVKAGDNENPTGDITSSSFTFSSSTNPKFITVKVSASTSSANVFKKNGSDDAEGKKEVQKTNGDGKSDGTAWTWKCTIKLTSDATNGNLELEEKDRLFKEDGKGLFAILKKDYSSDTTNRKKAKEVKAKFIRDCGKLRSIEENKKFNKSDSLPTGTTEVSSSINFDLTKKTGSSAGNNLVPKKESKSLFDHWFLESYKDGVV